MHAITIEWHSLRYLHRFYAQTRCTPAAEVDACDLAACLMLAQKMVDSRPDETYTSAAVGAELGVRVEELHNRMGRVCQVLGWSLHQRCPIDLAMSALVDARSQRALASGCETAALEARPIVASLEGLLHRSIAVVGVLDLAPMELAAALVLAHKNGKDVLRLV